MRTVWDPVQYGRYADERARPFHDLVARVGATDPSTVVDLGCGSGELTATLLDRWPRAQVTGVDNSSQMLATAQSQPPRLTFARIDATVWTPDTPVDVLISNAMLQWIPEHADLITRLVSCLAPGGWLAFQVPGNADAATHRLLDELRRSTRWRSRLGPAASRTLTSLEPDRYLDLLAGLGCAADVWETTYLHVLPGQDPILDWYRGTGLRPVLQALGEDDAREFTEEYAALLREAYPPRPYGTVLPFRRIFAVAHRVEGMGHG